MIERTDLANQDHDNVIAQFAREVELAARVSKMKLSLEQRGVPYTETDTELHFDGYVMRKDRRS